MAPRGERRQPTTSSTRSIAAATASWRAAAVKTGSADSKITTARPRWSMAQTHESGMSVVPKVRVPTRALSVAESPWPTRHPRWRTASPTRTRSRRCGCSSSTPRRRRSRPRTRCRRLPRRSAHRTPGRHPWGTRGPRRAMPNRRPAPRRVGAPAGPARRRPWRAPPCWPVSLGAAAGSGPPVVVVSSAVGCCSAPGVSSVSIAAASARSGESSSPPATANRLAPTKTATIRWFRVPRRARVREGVVVMSSTFRGSAGGSEKRCRTLMAGNHRRAVGRRMSHESSPAGAGPADAPHVDRHGPNGSRWFAHSSAVRSRPATAVREPAIIDSGGRHPECPWGGRPYQERARERRSLRRE